METKLTQPGKPTVHTGCFSTERNRSPLSTRKREEIISAIEKKILEGKTMIKVIYYELCDDGMISEHKNYEGIPNLKLSIIAKYVNESIKKLGIIRTKKQHILIVYERYKKHDPVSIRKRGYGKLIAKEVGCGVKFVWDVLKLKRKTK